MRIEQLIFTSCKTGIENRGAGFQVYSHSSGLDQSQVRDIQARFCQYQAPYDLPGMPTQDQIDQLFPVSFSCKRFDEHRMCLTQTVYLGRDYVGETGRFGNYISHVMVIPDDAFEFYPVELYKTSAFRSNLSPAESNSTQTPGYLDCLTAEFLTLQAGVINLESVTDFIAQDDRISHLKKLIGAVFEANKTKKKILIRDSNTNVLYWIAALLMAFPQKTAKYITFDSYVFDSTFSDAMIIGVSEQGTILSDGSGYLFDFINNVFDENEYAFKLLDLIEVGYGLSYDALTSFHSFLEEINYLKADDNLDYAYDLYALRNGVAADILDLKGTLEFALSISNKAVLDDMANSILKNKKEIFSKYYFDDFILLNQFLLEKVNSEATKEFLWESIQQVVKFVDKSTYDDAKEFTLKSLNNLTSKKDDVYTYLLRKLNEDLKANSNVYFNIFSAAMTFSFIQAMNISLKTYFLSRENVFKQVLSNINLMTDADALTTIQGILSEVSCTEDIIELFIIVITKLHGRKQLTAQVTDYFFTEVVLKMPELDLVYLNKMLMHRGIDDIGLLVFKKSLNHMKDPASLFWDYHAFIQKTGDSNLINEISLIYLSFSQLKGSQFVKELNKLCQNINQKSNDNLLLTLIREYNANLRLDERINQETLDAIKKLISIADLKKLKYDKGKINLIYFADQMLILVNQKQSEKTIKLCESNIDISYSAIEPRELNQFFKKHMSGIVPIMFTERQHASLHQVFLSVENQFFNNYIPALFNCYKQKNAENLILSFLAYFATLKNKDEFEKVFIIHMSKLSDDDLNELTDKVKENYPEQKKEWYKYNRRVQEVKSNSFAGFMKRIFSSKEQ